ncbi:MAG: hypothetical protein WDN00_16445 [Limisphaerales bacterium]
MKINPLHQPNYLNLSLAITGIFLAVSAYAEDPRTNSWFTAYSAKYARIYTTDANRTNGVAVTTWSNGTQTQSHPAYSGVQEIYSSADWVLSAHHRIGRANHGALAKWQFFPICRSTPRRLYRIPRTNSALTTKTQTGGGPIGYFVDGVAMFDSRDAFYWNGSADTQGTGSWNREAYVNESATFDPGLRASTAGWHLPLSPPVPSPCVIFSATM